MSEERRALIESRLAVLSPRHLEITDESHRHAGHASAKGGGHFVVTVVSEMFAGKSLLQRHRMVYAAMGDAMEQQIHALSITAKTPDEAGLN